MLLFRFYFPQDYKTCRIFQFIFLNIYQCAVLIRHRFFFFRYNLEFDHVLITKKLIFFLTHHYDLNISLSLSFTFSLPISIFFCHEDELEPEASHTDWYHETKNRKKKYVQWRYEKLCRIKTVQKSGKKVTWIWNLFG